MLKKVDKLIYEPETGYDLSAQYYDCSVWSDFWTCNEVPIVCQWLRSVKDGIGLDAGSGTGRYISFIVQNCKHCVALDISKEMLKLNIKKNQVFEGSKVTYTKGNIARLPFKSNTFDWILCTRVLSHYPIIDLPFHQFHKILKPGGQLFLSDVHPDHPYDDTSFQVKKEKINIRTFKHSIDDIKSQAIQKGFTIVEFKEIYLDELLEKPNPMNFIKLYANPEKKVFYYCILQK